MLEAGALRWDLFAYIALGVILSIVIPAAVKAAKAGDGLDTTPPWVRRIWELIRPYLPWVIISLAVPIVILFLSPDLADPRAAFAAGYAWDSTLQKFTGKP